MHDSRMKRHGAWLATAALVTEIGFSGIAAAADNPFQMKDLSTGYQLAHQDKHDEKQPAQTEEKDKTGSSEPDHSTDKKKTETEGKCGAEHMKINEGKCGGNSH